MPHTTTDWRSGLLHDQVWEYPMREAGIIFLTDKPSSISFCSGGAEYWRDPRRKKLWTKGLPLIMIMGGLGILSLTVQVCMPAIAETGESYTACLPASEWSSV